MTLALSDDEQFLPWNLIRTGTPDREKHTETQDGDTKKEEHTGHTGAHARVLYRSQVFRWHPPATLTVLQNCS
jgi:hypothetical protein